MIECQYRWPMVVTNRGFLTWHCLLYKKSVNDDVCSNCSDCEGKCPKPPMVDLGFPRRSDEEIAAIYEVCKGCPLLKPNKVCKAMHPEFHPPDIVAQHPSNHCPENKW